MSIKVIVLFIVVHALSCVSLAKSSKLDTARIDCVPNVTKSYKIGVAQAYEICSTKKSSNEIAAEAQRLQDEQDN